MFTIYIFFFFKNHFDITKNIFLMTKNNFRFGFIGFIQGRLYQDKPWFKTGITNKVKQSCTKFVCVRNF